MSFIVPAAIIIPSSPLPSARQVSSVTAGSKPPTSSAIIRPMPLIVPSHNNLAAHPLLTPRSLPQDFGSLLIPQQQQHQSILPPNPNLHSSVPLLPLPPYQQQLMGNLTPSFTDVLWNLNCQSMAVPMNPLLQHPKPVSLPQTPPISPPSEQASPAVAVQTTFECSFCSKSFKRRQDMRRHALKHDLSKRISCDQCDKQFSRMDALQRHIRLKKCPFFQ
ncbi:hypothetical protein BCR33DRAFT_718996 [Rhizoclosmatium globosum]|uniref:C2H2-type domain-containing protein n=1 Tax=Rhizoclosmatium globosum TaxID=329046 RepID=A0A1Y2C2X1_9FUNG|nr:hypothetical protein BCR33DRAFT_718996 [Rhizoclosmatium globosum]|eukprot:ORY41393.1 hypothetical protein BCR33DRAFT_718996 [Rhizoclosmatium globosum]